MCDRFGHGREVASPDRSRVSPAGRGLRGCPVGPEHGVPVSIVAIPFDNVGQDLVGVLNQWPHPRCRGSCRDGASRPEKEQHRKINI